MTNFRYMVLQLDGLKMPFIKETFECDACKCTAMNVAFIIHKVNVLNGMKSKKVGLLNGLLLDSLWFSALSGS